MLNTPKLLSLCAKALVGCLLAVEVCAQPEVLTIEGARIRGNQELPTVLYVVPWQPPVVERLDKPATSFTLERPLEPLERTEFLRLMRYHQVFTAGPSGANATQGNGAP